MQQRVYLKYNELTSVIAFTDFYDARRIYHYLKLDGPLLSARDMLATQCSKRVLQRVRNSSYSILLLSFFAFSLSKEICINIDKYAYRYGV